MTTPQPPQTLDEETLRRWPLPQPDEDGDKESRGRVLVVAGGREMPGAAVLAATAALRAGAGKLCIATPASAAPWIAIAMPEARVIALPETDDGALVLDGVDTLRDVAARSGAVLVGPGMQHEAPLVEFALRLMVHLGDVPMVLDACALPALLQAMPARRGGALIATPHFGEMARLSGHAKAHVKAECNALAVAYAAQWNAVLALKGASTVIASPDGRSWRHDGGNIGLATSGSGDTLAGLITGLLARGAPAEQAVAWGVVLHAQAGARLARRFGLLGYLARELTEEVPALMQSLAADGATSPALRQNLPP